jgi:hypothetical protein
MVDLPTVKKEMIMTKFTITSEFVAKGDLDCQALIALIERAVDGVAEYHSVDHTDTKALSEQGLKVWAKRKIGLSLAAPKPVKAPKVEVAETVEA